MSGGRLSDGSEETGQRFEAIARRFEDDPEVSHGTGFGASPGLRVRGRIFAMLAGGALVVKLPQARVDQLIATGVAARFDPGHGRLMREWASIASDQTDAWHTLASEAHSFVGGHPTRST